MAIPKRRKSSSARDKRRSHLRVDEKIIHSCSNCGKDVLPHHVCSKCGYYKGQKVATVLRDKKDEKGKAKKLEKNSNAKKRVEKEADTQAKKKPESKKRRLFSRKAT